MTQRDVEHGALAGDRDRPRVDDARGAAREAHGGRAAGGRDVEVAADAEDADAADLRAGAEADRAAEVDRVHADTHADPLQEHAVGEMLVEPVDRALEAAELAVADHDGGGDTHPRGGRQRHLGGALPLLLGAVLEELHVAELEPADGQRADLDAQAVER
jgi:hypothetical protein